MSSTIKDATNLLAMALDDRMFEAGGGIVPCSYPYLALMERGVDLDTYRAALGALEAIGLVTCTVETIQRGPRFNDLAPRIQAAMVAHRKA